MYSYSPETTQTHLDRHVVWQETEIIFGELIDHLSLFIQSPRATKLEKADILEMTVDYIKKVADKREGMSPVRVLLVVCLLFFVCFNGVCVYIIKASSTFLI